jgi:hypothetical protein
LRTAAEQLLERGGRRQDVAGLDAYTRDRFLAALTTPRRR